MTNPRHEQFNKEYVKLLKKHKVEVRVAVFSEGKNWLGRLGIKLFGKHILLKPKNYIQDVQSK